MRSSVRLAGAALAACAFLLAPSQVSSGLAAIPSADLVPADAETEPVQHAGDAADDPALWVHPDDPALSLLIANDKKGALEVYDLDGSVLQRITSSKPFWGNVDVRQGVVLGGRTLDLVAATNGGVRLFRVDPVSRTLIQISGRASGALQAGGQGLCLYESRADRRVYAFTLNKKGVMAQWQIHDDDGDGLLLMRKVRTVTVVIGVPPREATEACAADDDTGALYVSEEDVALWRYGAEPTTGSARTRVDSVQPNGNLAADVEGIAIVRQGAEAGYLIVSAQNIASPQQSYFAVFDRQTNAYLRSFRIVASPTADGCERTDGIAAHAGDLGPSYPYGIFVCQDNGNTAPAQGNQNFKLTRLERVVPL